jgi:hypothetical protein
MRLRNQIAQQMIERGKKKSLGALRKLSLVRLKASQQMKSSQSCVPNSDEIHSHSSESTMGIKRL